MSIARSSKICANDVFVKSRTYPPPMPSTASRKVLSGNDSLLMTRCSSTRPVVPYRAGSAVSVKSTSRCPSAHSEQATTALRLSGPLTGSRWGVSWLRYSRHHRFYSEQQSTDGDCIVLTPRIEEIQSGDDSLLLS